MLLDGVVSSRVLNILLESRDLRVKREREDFCSSDWNFVLEKDNHVIGIMILKKSNRVGFENCGEIDALYLDPNEIGKGYGKLLFLKACEGFQMKIVFDVSKKYLKTPNGAFFVYFYQGDVVS